ncbi:MAG TPA: DUF433 domain-containing protein [Pirellulales bacterium]|nr:DUF433 domain-containing protein [Pirellulales bacterium]
MVLPWTRPCRVLVVMDPPIPCFGSFCTGVGTRTSDSGVAGVGSDCLTHGREFGSLQVMVILHHSPVRSDPAVMRGTLVFRASRVPAQTLLDYLDDGYTLDEFLEMFPSVDREDAAEFLRLARGEADADRA